MMPYEEKISWIKGTPLAVEYRNIRFIPPHIHGDDVVEIILCLKGKVSFYYENEQLNLLPGEAIAVNRDTHYLCSDRDNICVSFYINRQWFSDRYPYINSMIFIYEHARDSTSSLRRSHFELRSLLITLLVILDDMHDQDERRKMITDCVTRITDLLVKDFDIMFFLNPEADVNSKLMIRQHELVAYLDQHWNEKVTLKSMADDFNLSKSYISQLMRTDLNFRKCLGYLRVCKSEKLLLSTDMNIMDISEECGFSDKKYFYRAFREWCECTPTEFRVNYTNIMRERCRETAACPDTVRNAVNDLLRQGCIEHLTTKS